jgi:hypothetical protein
MDPESHSAALERMKRDLSSATDRISLAKFYLAAGESPRYVSHRFGVDLERCERYAAALKQQREKA